MPVQTGTHDLANGASTASVVFPVAYTGSPPDYVHVEVENTTDGAPLVLGAIVTARSTTGFSVKLSAATDSANYDLHWWAAREDDAPMPLPTRVRSLARQTPVIVTPQAKDLVPVVTMQNGVPRTLPCAVERLDARWVRRMSVPASAGAAGTQLDLAIDGSYLYVSSGASAWVRIPLASDTVWGNDYTIRPTRRGVATLNSSTQVQSISFASAFASGSVPVITACQVFNVSADSAKLVLTGMPVAASLSGFDIALSGIPDSANYKLFYEAQQLS